MAVEKEIAVASNDRSNAPSLQSICASGRERKPTKKLTDSQLPTTTNSPLKTRRTRHNRLYQLKTTPKSVKVSKTNIQEKDQREQDFDADSSTQAKYEGLVKALGHEEFPDH